MELMINKKSKSLVAIIILIVISTMSIKSFAVNKIYTKELSKGDNLVFTGNLWKVYKTKAIAESVGNGKHPSDIRKIKKGEKINILKIDGNVLKINNNEFIYYGSTASKYFNKVEKKDKQIDQKNDKNIINPEPTPEPATTPEPEPAPAPETKQKSNGNKRYTDGEYYVVSKSLDSILKKVGAQNPNECLIYSERYAKKILNNNSANFKILGSNNKKAILKVIASEINAGRPVIARVTTSRKTKINGIEMCGRHFVTIVRNKEKC